MIKKSKKGKFNNMIFIYLLSSIIFLSALGYCLAIFTEIPGLSTLRNIWIETAMTTADHQWLATKFIPKFVIDNVMSQKIEDTGEVGITNIDKKNKNLVQDSNLNYDISILNNKSIIFEDTDPFNNEVIVNDIEQGIKIVKVKSSTYTGRLVFIDDPSRVFVSTTDNKNKKGKLILDYLKDENAIIGINANGFEDYNGVGHGGNILGFTMSNGEIWGNGDISTLTTIGFDNENRLIVGKINSFEEYNLRDSVQYKPILILNGKVFVEGTAGWGMQPRTIVAQREDGVVMFLVVDGRKPGYSIGITMGEAAELLLKYGAVTAAACDGGSSSVLAYNGDIINRPSTPMVTGRYLPNAILVKSK